ncbi:MAG: OsmC family protein [Candidatus Azobacteroides sp.]|nr:OsmC family protein [Candidatus Azobacteroides sp.]
MAAIETICLGNLRTEVTHTQSGTKIVTDAPTDNKGKGEYFSPTDLVTTALGSCIMTIMDMFAQEHGIDLTGTRIVTEKVMSSNPRRIGEIKIDLYFKGEFTDKQKTMLRRVADTCPVGKSLHPDLIQTINFHFEK